MPISPYMKTAESLSALYEIIKNLNGPEGARKSLTTALSLVLREIEDEGLEVTPELIEQKLAVYVQDFVEVAKKNQVA